MTPTATPASVPAPGTHIETRRLESPRPETVFGFWVYIMTDIMIFASLFVVYIIQRREYAGGPTQRDLFDLSDTLKETMLLLASSATCGFAMLGVHKQKMGQVLFWLGLTFLLGAGFLFLELSEFAKFIDEGAGPGRSAFLSAFFTLVGTHGLHVTAGMLWMLVLAGQMLFLGRGLSNRIAHRLLAFSLFWHFLDVIWIGLFTFVYLDGKLL